MKGPLTNSELQRVANYLRGTSRDLSGALSLVGATAASVQHWNEIQSLETLVYFCFGCAVWRDVSQTVDGHVCMFCECREGVDESPSEWPSLSMLEEFALQLEPTDSLEPQWKRPERIAPSEVSRDNNGRGKRLQTRPSVKI